jgi:hypothetical protein
MANTNVLKIIAEPYVRSWCSSRYGIEFEDCEKELRLITGGIHRFDVVAKDGSVVAGVKTSALRDDGGVSGGVIKSTFAELYFLSIVKAAVKLMILTDKDYCEHFRRISKGKVAEGIEIIHCPLPKEIEENIAAVHQNCRKEIGKR